MGVKKTGMICEVPVLSFDFYNKDKDWSTPDYDCEFNELPFYYPGWDPKWYSPICRDWFKEQESHPTRNTLGEIYINSAKEFGLTPCAPITSRDKGELKFEAALCTDISPSGSLDQYYEFDSNGNDGGTENETYMLFNVPAGGSVEDSLTDPDSKFS